MADIPDGSTIAFSGFAMPGTPFNLIKALIEQGARRLTLVANTTGGAQQPRMPDIGMLVENGQVAKVICAFTAATRPTDVLPFTKYYEAGEVDAELVPQGTLAERLRAAGAGIPAFYTPTAVGTELAAGRETRVIDGREYLLEYALKLDYAFIRARIADAAGNLRFHRSQRNFGPVMATAARVTIAELDEPVVPVGSIDPDDVHTPGIYVHRLVQVPPDPEGIWPSKRQERQEMSGTKGLTRQQMADRVAREFQDGWIVNLGVGIPTMCSNTDIGDRDITYHSENGVIGYGPVALEGHEDLNLVNAGGQNVTLRLGAAVVHHADSFGVIRGGHIDATVMGAYQVSMTGDFANWKLKGQKGGGIGGAMDLAACAKRVFIILEHVTRDGSPRLVTACDLPVTARGVVTLVATNYGLFEPAATGFRLLEIAPGLTVDDVRGATGATLMVADGLRQIAVGD